MAEEEAPPVVTGGWTFSASDGKLAFSLTWTDGVVDVALGAGMTYTKAAQQFFDHLRGVKT